MRQVLDKNNIHFDVTLTKGLSIEMCSIPSQKLSKYKINYEKTISNLNKTI